MRPLPAWAHALFRLSEEALSRRARAQAGTKRLGQTAEDVMCRKLKKYADTNDYTALLKFSAEPAGEGNSRTNLAVLWNFIAAYGSQIKCIRCNSVERRELGRTCPACHEHFCSFACYHGPDNPETTCRNCNCVECSLKCRMCRTRICSESHQKRLGATCSLCSLPLCPGCALSCPRCKAPTCSRCRSDCRTPHCRLCPRSSFPAIIGVKTGGVLRPGHAREGEGGQGSGGGEDCGGGKQGVLGRLRQPAERLERMCGS